MRKLALAAILTFAACGGGDDDDDVVVPTGDAGGPDGGSSKCDPVEQTGCDAGEKCTWVTVSEDPDLGKTDCVADGTVALGDACTVGDPGATTGFDNCAKGGMCLGGICATICREQPGNSEQPDTCGEASICVRYNVFEDLGEDSTVGLCNATCDPIAQLGADGARNPDYTDCPEGQGCYLKPTSGKAACGGVPVAAEELGQNDTCYGPTTESCYQNGCPAGYQSFLYSAPSTPPAVCGAFCSPVNTAVGITGDRDGANPANCGLARIGAATQGCRFIQSIYDGADFDGSIIPVEYGLCTDEATWGNCAEFDPQGMVNAWNGGYTGANDEEKQANANAALCVFCGFDAETCMEGERAPACEDVGCIDIATAATYDAMYMQPAGAARAREIRERSTKRLRDQLLESGAPGIPMIQ